MPCFLAAQSSLSLAQVGAPSGACVTSFCRSESVSDTPYSYQRRFDPYSDNGGTILAVSSRDFAVIASDTRQSVGYSIQSRYQQRCFQLTDEAVIAVQGFMADSNTLVKRLKQQLEWYFQCVLANPHGVRDTS